MNYKQKQKYGPGRQVGWSAKKTAHWDMGNSLFSFQQVPTFAAGTVFSCSQCHSPQLILKHDHAVHDLNETDVRLLGCINISSQYLWVLSSNPKKTVTSQVVSLLQCNKCGCQSHIEKLINSTCPLAEALYGGSKE